MSTNSNPNGSSQSQRTADDQLSDYLNDHLAAAASGVQAIKAARDTWSGSEHEQTFTSLFMEIDADREELEQLIHRLGFSKSGPRMALAWIGARLGRVNPLNPARSGEGMAGQLELEALQSAVHGKESLWDTLLAIAAWDHRLERTELERLKERAGRQQDRIAAVMKQTVALRFAEKA